MKQRIITGAILGIFALGVIFFSDLWIYPAVLTVLCVIGVYEMLNCIGVSKNLFIAIPSYIFALVCSCLALNTRYGVLMAVVGIYMFILLVSLVYANEKVTVVQVTNTFTMIVYITVCFVCLIKMRYVTTEVGSFGGETIGQYVYLLVFIAAWITDTFAYFTGVFFGKHKLCPKISPKKTFEGSVGGIVFCVAAFIIYGYVAGSMYNIVPNYIGLAVVGFIMSVVAQTGDLLMSVIKRNYGIKDYGKLFPGHGGVLDRFDSVLILAPVLLLITEDAQYMQILFTINI